MYSPYSDYTSCNVGIANLENLTSITREMNKPFYGGRILGDNKIKSYPLYINKDIGLITEQYCLDKKNWPKEYDIATYDSFNKECTLQKFGDINANFIIPDVI